MSGDSAKTRSVPLGRRKEFSKGWHQSAAAAKRAHHVERVNHVLRRGGELEGADHPGTPSWHARARCHAVTPAASSAVPSARAQHTPHAATAAAAATTNTPPSAADARDAAASQPVQWAGLTKEFIPACTDVPGVHTGAAPAPRRWRQSRAAGRRRRR